MIKSNCLKWELASGLPHDSEAWLGFDLCWGGFGKIELSTIVCVFAPPPSESERELKLPRSCLMLKAEFILGLLLTFLEWVDGVGNNDYVEWVFDLLGSLSGETLSQLTRALMFFFLFLHVWDWSLQVSTGRALLSSSLLRYYVLAYFGE